MWNSTPDEHKPLSPSQREIVVDEVQDESLVTRYSVLGSLYTGLNSSDLAHLQNEMVRTRNSGVIIVLPPGTVECKSGVGFKNKAWSVSPRAVAESNGCEYCSGEYEFRSPRGIPVRHEATVTVLTDFLSFHDGTPTAETIRSRVAEFGQQCGIDPFSAARLRYTFPVILAEKGFTEAEIVDVMGLSEVGVEKTSFADNVGAYCRGENPFYCSTEDCSRKTTFDTQFCGIHSPETNVCGAPIDGGSCEKPVGSSGGRCAIHREGSSNICGADLSQGGTCERRVSTSAEYCLYHRDESETQNVEVCGAETLDGDRCQRQDIGPDGYCGLHSE